MQKEIRLFFPKPALRFFVVLLAVLLATAFCVEQYIQRQTSTTLLNTSWKQEDTRIKQNNLQKLGNLDESFPLMTTPGGHMPLQSGKKHHIAAIADSFSWGDGLANINDVWWRQIERELERRGYTDVEVVALGWNGAQTKEELGWIRDPRFTDLKAEAIVMGYVVNDPDMGLLPQNYKVYRMFFADDVFRWWLPELVEQFQARYMRKKQDRQAKAKLAYGPEEWLKLLLEGENFALWTQIVGKLAETLQSLPVPSVVVSLPVVPDKEYYEPLYRKPMRVFEDSGVPLLNILDEYVQDKGEQAGTSPLLWTANPANGHPGPGATLYYAQKVADWLEANAPQALGDKKPSFSYMPRFNDWYPWSAQPSLADGKKLHLLLPQFREMGVLPVGKPHVLLSFERAVPLKSIQITSPGAMADEVLVSVVGKDGLDDRSLHRCKRIGDIFVVPPLPEGSLVNTIRIVPATDNRTMTAILDFSQGVAP